VEHLRHDHRFLEFNRTGIIKRQRPFHSPLISTGMSTSLRSLFSANTLNRYFSDFVCFCFVNQFQSEPFSSAEMKVKRHDFSWRFVQINAGNKT